MQRKVITAPEAAAGLRQARSWLTQKGSGPNGRARWEQLRDARRMLKTHPYLGPEAADHAGMRCLVVSDYRIIYRVIADTGDSASAGDVLILAVFGPGQP
jgi:plasmid stabilization system protein ParE